MKIDYRLAEEDDLEPIHYVMLEAMNQFGMQMGRPPIEIDFQDYLPLWRHFLGSSEGGFWVAEVKGRVTGFACSILRGDLWLLSYLMVLPQFQGQGIGGALLERALELSQKEGVKILATYADSSNWPSISLYARHGIFPRLPILRLGGSITSLRLEGEKSEPPDFEVASLSDQVVDALGEIDKQVRGGHRPQDHHFWLGVPTMRCYLFRERRKHLAYLYLSNEGTIGPLAALKVEHMRPILEFAIDRLADQGVDNFLARVPGTNTEAISLLYERGFTIQEIQLLISSLSFGRWENYIISRPSLL